MIYVFSYRNSKIPKMPIVDCRGMQNPFSDKLTDEEKIENISQDPMFKVLVQMVVSVALYKDVAVGCTHGKHRSVAVANEAAKLLATEWEYYSEERKF